MALAFGEESCCAAWCGHWRVEFGFGEREGVGVGREGEAGSEPEGVEFLDEGGEGLAFFLKFLSSLKIGRLNSKLVRVALRLNCDQG